MKSPITGIIILITFCWLLSSNFPLPIYIAHARQILPSQGLSAIQVLTNAVNNPPQDILIYSYNVINAWPHDPEAFTQGLIFFKGHLYESTGLNGRSSLRKVDLKTGKILKKIDLPQQYFAEGLTVFRGKVFQLTWLSERGFVYNLKDFTLLNDFFYKGEGWGLTHDEQYLIKSNGTNQLQFIRTTDFKIMRTIDVFYQGLPLNNLNELEYIKGEIFANVWQTDLIVRIAPDSGRILGVINLEGLLTLADKGHTHPVDVLNGIAYDEKNDRIFVTGKLWPRVFEVKLATDIK
ncbi:MAG: glutaminyl-peptide cyclotransferase [bacterium]